MNYEQIVPAECKYEILKTKIEIRLRKVDVTVNWKSLDYSGAETAPAAPNLSNG